ncbi:MAG: NAD(P) transhydrogenase subunit alpha [Acholeplasmataceae bacterium]|jgi:NAD(P) transhydrogenase subunit alpha
MIIGIPKEILKGEKRVSATPQTVKKMIRDGHQVFVEKNAGVDSFYLDQEYIEAGAIILEDIKELYAKADVVLKVKEPQVNDKVGQHEIEMMRKGAILITFLHPANHVNHEMVLMLKDKGITSFTLDGVPRISRAQAMDALSSMSTCAGYKSVMMAANSLPKFLPMIGSAVGMIRPGNVFVVGCGVAGLRAIATAKGLGAQVYACDIRAEAVEQAKSLGARIVELNIPKEVAVSSDGKHANHLPKEYLLQEREQIKDAVQNADILILCALVFGKQAPILVTEEMVKSMKTGSYIVDISIDQGGNCALTQPAEVIEIHGVKIDGTKNIPGMIPTSSTYMFSENIYNFLKYLVRDNKLYLDMNDEIISSTIVTYKNKLLHEGTIEAMRQ